MDKRLRLDKKRTLNVIFRGRAAAESESRVESRGIRFVCRLFSFVLPSSMYI